MSILKINSIIYLSSLIVKNLIKSLLIKHNKYDIYDQKIKLIIII